MATVTCHVLYNRAPRHFDAAPAADLSEMRRAKSDIEIRRLRQLETRVRTGLGADSFRGVVAKNGVAPAFTRGESVKDNDMGNPTWQYVGLRSANFVKKFSVQP